MEKTLGIIEKKTINASVADKKNRYTAGNRCNHQALRNW
jgi:4'-phosphopantetheinyl transferase EntD